MVGGSEACETEAIRQGRREGRDVSGILDSSTTA